MARGTSEYKTHSNLNEEICISRIVVAVAVVENENSVNVCEIKKISSLKLKVYCQVRGCKGIFFCLFYSSGVVKCARVKGVRIKTFLQFLRLFLFLFSRRISINKTNLKLSLKINQLNFL